MDLPGHFVRDPALVPFDGSFDVSRAQTGPPDDAPNKKARKAKLATHVAELSELQEVLYAHDQVSLLVIFQAMDAAGKDGTIRAVFSGVNPAGCHVTSFKAPSSEELDHDFLWRGARALPERGRIGVHNRSWYEEVLVVRVHPTLLDGQRLPWRKDVWSERLQSIAAFERHLAANGTVVVKFFLNVSTDEQRQRFLSRIDEPHKHWKFSPRDVTERRHWSAYQEAYQAALAETSRPWAPWYAIPADSKSYARLCVARILVQTLQGLDLRFPEVDPAVRAEMAALREGLMAEPG